MKSQYKENALFVVNTIGFVVGITIVSIIVHKVVNAAFE